MDISALTQNTIKLPLNPLGADLAGRALPNPFPLEQAGGAGEIAFPGVKTGSGGTGTFGESLEKAIAEIEGKGRAADSAAYKYASGEPIPVHTVIIAAEQARLSIALAAEVRNKVIEAYQELSRTAG